MATNSPQEFVAGQGFSGVHLTLGSHQLPTASTLPLQFAALWFPENAPPGAVIAVPTLDKDPSRRFFGRDFLHALGPMYQPAPLYLRRVV